jgi:hypothetical protein
MSNPLNLIRIDVSGLDVTERALVRLMAGLADLRMFWPRLVPMFIEWMREQFDTEGQWGGDAWEPLSPKYAAWKTEHYPGKGILVATGDLRRAASTPRRIAAPQQFVLEIDDPKVAYHQEGTDVMPARPLLPDSLVNQVSVQVTQAAEEYVDELARSLGLL